jgi:hypothetical protein
MDPRIDIVEHLAERGLDTVAPALAKQVERSNFLFSIITSVSDAMAEGVLESVRRKLDCPHVELYPSIFTPPSCAVVEAAVRYFGCGFLVDGLPF